LDRTCDGSVGGARGGALARLLAIYDESSGQWISDAEIAEATYTAFNNRNQDTAVTAQLIVR